MISPTPWKISKSEPHMVVDSNDCIVAIATLPLSEQVKDPSPLTSSQNARLIAHAPQMLEILKDLLHTLEGCEIETADEVFDIHVEVEIKKIRRMIESAEDITR